MDSVSFTVLGEPTGKGRPKFNTQSRKAYTPTKTVNYETWVKMEYCRQCNNHKFPDDAMIEMEITAYYRIAKSDSKKKKQMKLQSGFLNLWQKMPRSLNH